MRIAPDKCTVWVVLSICSIYQLYTSLFILNCHCNVHSFLLYTTCSGDLRLTGESDLATG